jgi:hypothetical protein
LEPERSEPELHRGAFQVPASKKKDVAPCGSGSAKLLLNHQCITPIRKGLAAASLKMVFSQVMINNVSHQLAIDQPPLEYCHRH